MYFVSRTINHGFCSQQRMKLNSMPSGCERCAPHVQFQKKCFAFTYFYMLIFINNVYFNVQCFIVVIYYHLKAQTSNHVCQSIWQATTKKKRKNKFCSKLRVNKCVTSFTWMCLPMSMYPHLTMHWMMNDVDIDLFRQIINTNKSQRDGHVFRV